MRFAGLVEMLTSMEDNSTPVCLLGPPGIGKTSVGKALAESMTARRRSKNPAAPAAICRVLDLSSRLPEDIGGLPYRDGGVTRYAPQSWLAELCQPGAYGVLILDDLPAAVPAVQVATRQLVLDRAVGDAVLSEDIIIIVTGNRSQDKSAAGVLPAHFRNSVCLVDVEIDLDDWCSWYAAHDGHDPVIASFLRYRPSHLSKLPKDADERGAFATPRTWAKLGKMFSMAQKSGNLLPIAAGLVGEGVATEFVGYVNVKAALVAPDKVLLDPKGALPNPASYLNTPDKAYALITGIAETAAAWCKNSGSAHHSKAPALFLTALGHSANGNREYMPVAISTFVAYGGEIKALVKAYGQMKDNTDVQSVITYLREMIKGAA